MGNCDCENQQYQQEQYKFYDSNKWETIENHPLYTIIRHRQYSNMIKQKWSIRQRQSLAIYQWRKEQALSHLPKIYDYGEEFDEDNNFIQSYVVTDKLIQITNLENISVTEGLYVAKAIFQEIEKLYNKFSYFTLTKDMIYVTPFGQPIIWISENLASNNPQIPMKMMMEKIFTEKILIEVQKLIPKKDKLPFKILKIQYLQALKKIMFELQKQTKFSYKINTSKLNKFSEKANQQKYRSTIIQTISQSKSTKAKQNSNSMNRQLSPTANRKTLQFETPQMMNSVYRYTYMPNIEYKQNSEIQNSQKNDKEEVDPDKLLEQLILQSKIYF